MAKACLILLLAFIVVMASARPQRTTYYDDEKLVCTTVYRKSCPEVWEVQGSGVKVWVPDTSRCFNLVSLHIKCGLSGIKHG